MQEKGGGAAQKPGPLCAAPVGDAECSLDLLHHDSGTHAAADAEGGQTLLSVLALHHLVDQGDDDTGAGSTNGWPRAMAPPLTLTLLMSKCSSRATAMD